MAGCYVLLLVLMDTTLLKTTARHYLVKGRVSAETYTFAVTDEDVTVIGVFDSGPESLQSQVAAYVTANMGLGARGYLNPIATEMVDQEDQNARLAFVIGYVDFLIERTEGIIEYLTDLGESDSMLTFFVTYLTDVRNNASKAS